MTWRVINHRESITLSFTCRDPLRSSVSFQGNEVGMHQSPGPMRVDTIVKVRSQNTMYRDSLRCGLIYPGAQNSSFEFVYAERQTGLGEVSRSLCAAKHIFRLFTSLRRCSLALYLCLYHAPLLSQYFFNQLTDLLEIWCLFS
jgi:hypothetical protein